MSAKYTFLAWDTPIENAPLKLSLLQLANNADDNGFSRYSITKMAKACGMSERTFMRKIAELEQMGILTVERRPNRPSLYTLNDDEMGVTECHLHLSRVTESHPTVTESHLLGDRESPDPNNVPNNVPNSLYLDQKIESDFEIFWLAGMRKINKKGALKSFKTLCKNQDLDSEQIAKMLKADVVARLEAKQFGFETLHPTTYINGERWNDEISQRPKPVNQSTGFEHETPTERTRRAFAEQERQQRQPSQDGMVVVDGWGDLPD